MNAINAAKLAIAAMDNSRISQENYEEAKDRAIVYGILGTADPTAEVDVPEWLEERAVRDE